MASFINILMLLLPLLMGGAAADSCYWVLFMPPPVGRFLLILACSSWCYYWLLLVAWCWLLLVSACSLIFPAGSCSQASATTGCRHYLCSHCFSFSFSYFLPIYFFNYYKSVVRRNGMFFPGVQS